MILKIVAIMLKRKIVDKRKNRKKVIFVEVYGVRDEEI